MSKIGLIVEGGGMKCSYSAGILDAFLDNKINFDYCIGVSAGAANLASFIAGQRERNLRYYTIHVKDPKYISIGNLLKTGSIFGLEYIYGPMTNRGGADPLDFPALMANPCEYRIVSTDAATCKPVYFTKDDMKQDDYRTLMASCAIPGFCKPITIGDKTYFDGGVSDSIPIKKALEEGCDKVIVIFERPRGFVKPPESHRMLYKHMLRKYPAMIKGLDERHINYRASMQMCYDLEKDGKVLVLAPSRQVKITTFTKDPAVMQELYDLGHHDYAENAEKIQAFMSHNMT